MRLMLYVVWSADEIETNYISVIAGVAVGELGGGGEITDTIHTDLRHALYETATGVFGGGGGG